MKKKLYEGDVNISKESGLESMVYYNFVLHQQKKSQFNGKSALYFKSYVPYIFPMNTFISLLLVETYCTSITEIKECHLCYWCCGRVDKGGGIGSNGGWQSEGSGFEPWPGGSKVGF